MPRAPLRRVRLLVALPAATLVVAWLAGLALSDRFLWSQFLAWIPTPAALLAAAATAWATFPFGRAGRGLALLACAAAVAALARLVLVEHRPWAAGRAPAADGLRILHGNLLWPNRKASPDLIRFVESRTEELILFSEPGYLLSDQRGKALVQSGWTVIRVPHFAVLTRLPVREARPLVVLEDASVSLLRVDASTAGAGELSLWLVDLPSSPRLPRMDFARRLRALLDDANAPPPDLVVGDLNLTRGSAATAQLFPGMRDAFSEAGRGVGASWPSMFPLWHIDHVLLAPHVRALEYRLPRLPMSLHRGQEVVIAPAAKE